MKRFLLASAAALSLAAAMPAFAQITQPLPATPPVEQPTPNPDATTEQSAEAQAQAPVVEGSTETQTQAEASATAEPPSVAAQASVAGEAQSTPQTEPGAPTATPPVTAEAQTPATTPAPTPAATAQAAPAQTATADSTAAEGGAPTFAGAAAVCQPRTTSVHFGQRGSSLSQQNRNAIEYAVDAASVCNLQQVTIADSGEGSISSRRASAVRAALVRQGVPEDRITVAQEANAEGASTGQLDVRMTFAGVETGDAQMASNQATAPAPATPMTPEAQPQTAPPAAEPQAAPQAPSPIEPQAEQAPQTGQQQPST